jgi:hypothetical protein
VNGFVEGQVRNCVDGLERYCENGPHDVRKYFNLLLGMTLSFYMLLGFYSIIFATRRLMRPGVSTVMRRLFLKKHVIYVVALIFFQLFNLLTNYYELFKPEIVQNKEGSED